MPYDLFSSAPAPADEPITRVEQTRALSVSAVNALARRLLEEGLPPLWVSGEVTGWKRHGGSGHCYFTLRDADAQLRCVLFRADAARLPTDPEEGMHVRALGGLTLYERRGDYQMVVRRIEGDGGDGLWRLAFDRLRRRLEEEGALAAARKRPLPRCPVALGVVTSPVGAVFHDIRHVVERRAPWTRLILSPARVQGDGAAAEIAAAIARLAGSGLVDVLVVGRGGGSVEDLWPFNEEAVARAILASAVPVISAVGHETDVTIADLVADVRAPTPSAAAELAVLDRDAVQRELDATELRMRSLLAGRVVERRRRLESAGERLSGAIRRVVERRAHRLGALAGRLEALSPLAALGRGYAVPLDGAGRLLRSASAFHDGDDFRLRVVDGSVSCRVHGAPVVDAAGGAPAAGNGADSAGGTSRDGEGER